jgi:Asp/Glu/hydantoin racemase
VADSFGRRLKEFLHDDIKIYNFWDEYLAIQPNEIGEFTEVNKERLLLDLKSMAMTDADLIVVTCSTLSPHLELARKTIQIPIVAIDDDMSLNAVKKADRILVLATARSAMEPVMDKLSMDGRMLGKTVKITGVVMEDAFECFIRRYRPKPALTPIAGAPLTWRR